MIKKCDICQKIRDKPSTKSELKITTTSSRPFERIFVDIIVMPTSKTGYTSALVVEDDLTKTFAIAPMKDQTTGTVARKLVDHVFCYYGIPEAIVTDNGGNLISELMKCLCQKLKIKRIQTSIYHPQSNAVERVNKDLKIYLRAFVANHKEDWSDYIKLFYFVHNTSYHSSIGESPFKILYGRNAELPNSLLKPYSGDTYFVYIKNLQDNLARLAKIAKENMIRHKQERKKRHDKNLRIFVPWYNDRVLWKVPRTLGNKLSYLYEGPYLVVDIRDKWNTTIRVGLKDKIVHNNNLIPYHEAND